MWEAEPEDHVDLMSDSLPRKAEKRSTGILETKKSHGDSCQECSGCSRLWGPREAPSQAPDVRTAGTPLNFCPGTQSAGGCIDPARIADAQFATCVRHELARKIALFCGSVLKLISQILLGHVLSRIKLIKIKALTHIYLCVCVCVCLCILCAISLGVSLLSEQRTL